MKIRTIERSHTKAGPGRYHGQCQLITDFAGNVLGTREPAGKRGVANFGGNWVGKEYLSYREHDLLTQLTRLGPSSVTREMGVHAPLTREQAMEIIREKRK